MSKATAAVSEVRPAVVAGRFYPANAATLARAVREFMAQADSPPPAPPRAVIAPHAGYICSGIVAGASFRALSLLPQAVYTVYLMGPAHWYPVSGIGVTDAEAFETPLGCVPVATDLVMELVERPPYRVVNAAHEPEHCLEVELPFLQTVLPGCRVVPMLFGEGADPEQVGIDLAGWLETNPHSLVVVSSDLSHFLPYAEAEGRDRAFLEAVVSGDAMAARRGQACGLIPILCLMSAARHLGWSAQLLDYRNSGDTCGSKQEVVGYGAVSYSP